MITSEGKRMLEQRTNIAEWKEAEDDDAELMRRIAGGDQRAFQKLMRRHLARTVRFAARILGGNGAAEDVAQEAFIRVWKHAGRFQDPDSAGAKFTTWFYKIIVNLCIDEKRKRSFSSIDDVQEPVDGKGSAEDKMQRDEKEQRVMQALGELPERQRAAFMLCFYEECSNKEAADALGVSLKALESLLVRSRRTLREKLQPERES